MSQTKAQLIDPVDGTIVNADINASAAIAGSKISPDFGSQNVVTTGTLGSDDITITGGQPALSFVDDGANPDYKFYNNNGTLRLYDITNTADRLVINTDGHVDVTGNLDVGAGIDVTGDIIASGDITTNGGDLTVSGSTAVIHLTDTNNDDDFSLMNENGNFRIRDATNSLNRLSIDSTGTVNVTGNLDVGAGIDVTGALSSTGDITITNTNPKVQLVDSNSDSDFQVQNDNGNFNVRDTTNSSNRLRIDANGDQTFSSAGGNASFTFTKSNAPSGEQTVTVKFDRNGTVIGGVGGPSQITGVSGNDMGIATTNGGNIRFGTGSGGAATNRVSVDTTGDMTIHDGDLVIGTAGHGIDFSATADGGGVSGTTMVNELLNDYEEGSFTGGFNDFNGSYSQNTGQYVKIGNFVCATIMIMGSGGSGSGDLKLTNLPFASDGVTIGSLYRSVGNVFGYQGLVTGGLEISAIITNNTSHAILTGTNNNAVATTLNRNGLNSSAFEVQITVTYHTNS